MRARRIILAVAYPLAVAGGCLLFGSLTAPGTWLGVGLAVFFGSAAVLGSTVIMKRPPPGPLWAPAPTRGPNDPPEHCPRCGATTRDIDRDTSSGRQIHTFGCENTACTWFERYDCGVALWVAMDQR